MEWDLGLGGVLLLVGMSLGVGIVAQLAAGRTVTRWLWLIAAAIAFVSGALISEVWFGWATQVELQPNIDGLSFEEVLLGLVVVNAVIVLVARGLARRAGRPHDRPDERPDPRPDGS
jgi:hypothetical protein